MSQKVVGDFVKVGTRWMLATTLISFTLSGILTMLGKDWYGYITSVPVTAQQVEANRVKLDTIGKDVKELLILNHKNDVTLHEHSVVLRYHADDLKKCREKLFVRGD